MNYQEALVEAQACKQEIDPLLPEDFVCRIIDNHNRTLFVIVELKADPETYVLPFAWQEPRLDLSLERYGRQALLDFFAWCKENRPQ